MAFSQNETEEETQFDLCSNRLSLTTVFRIDSAGTEGERRSRKARRRLEQYHKYTRTAPQTKMVMVEMAQRSRILGILKVQLTDFPGRDWV